MFSLTPRRIAGALVAALFLAIFLLIGALMQLAWRIHRPPPFEYSALSYPAEKPTFCAGEALVYTATLIVRRPAVVTQVQTIWSKTEQQTVVPANDFDIFIWNEATVITRQERIALPRSLAPGQYELRTARYEERTSPHTHIVPFEVVVCP